MTLYLVEEPFLASAFVHKMFPVVCNHICIRLRRDYDPLLITGMLEVSWLLSNSKLKLPP